MNKKSLAIAILAAGKGTRMNSSIPKVLHKINNKPMILSVVELSKELNPEKLITIVGYKKNLVMETLKNNNIIFVTQKEQKGTAHAIQQCNKELENFDGNLLVLSGDVPLITKNTIDSLLSAHCLNNSKASMLTTLFKDPTGYGRIVRNSNNKFKKIIEHKDATNEELSIKEINAGVYIFDSKTLFKKIDLIKNKNTQKEYYIVDIFNFLNSDEISVFRTKNSTEIAGVNTKNQLLKLSQ